jgi:hypothetical protein
MSNFCTAYYYDTTALIWHKCDQAGPFFICSTNDNSGVRIILLNQNNKTDLCLSGNDISGIKLIEKDNMIHIKTKVDDIRGFWLYEKTDLLDVYEVLGKHLPPGCVKK